MKDIAILKQRMLDAALAEHRWRGGPQSEGDNLRWAAHKAARAVFVAEAAMPLPEPTCAIAAQRDQKWLEMLRALAALNHGSSVDWADIETVLER